MGEVVRGGRSPERRGNLENNVFQIHFSPSTKVCVQPAAGSGEHSTYNHLAQSTVLPNKDSNKHSLLRMNLGG